MRPLIVSGCPGAGKSTVTRRLAAMCDRGVRVDTDAFFDFIAHPIDPSKPASAKQNESVVRAWCATASAFVSGGYDVFVDGVIGPWWFPVIRSVLGKFDFVLLTVPLEVSLARVHAREGQPGARPSVVERMYPQFARLADEFASQSIETDGLDIASTVQRVLALQTSGRCRVAG